MEASFPGARSPSVALRGACLRLAGAAARVARTAAARDILALRPDGCFACIEVKSGPRDFLTDRSGRTTASSLMSCSSRSMSIFQPRCRSKPVSSSRRD
jgi:hypothetical protein